MFAVIVRFQELTSYLKPLNGYFGPIDGGQRPIIPTARTMSHFITVLHT